MRPKRRETTPAPDRTAWLESLLLAATVALLVATPLLPSEGVVREGTFAPLSLLWTILLVGWAVLALLRPDRQLRFGWIGVAAAALIGWHTLAALTTGMQGNGRQALNVLWLWISYGIAAFLLRQLLKTPADCRALMVVLIALAAAESAHGVYEYFISKPAQIAEFRQNAAEIYRQAGATTEKLQQQLRWRIEAVEPLGTFSLTNSLAGLIAPWLIALLGIGLTALPRPDLRRTLIGAVSIALLLAGCLLLTKSRTAILATGGGVVLLAIYGSGPNSRLAAWISWKLLAATVGVAVVLGLIAVAIGGLDMQVLSEAPLSVRYRVEYWQATAAMIAEHPLFGCGPGQFQEFYTRYKLPQASETVADPHNFLLEIWATAGTPALLALLAMGAASVWQLSQTKPSPSTELERHGGRSLQRAWIYGGALAGLLLAYPVGLTVGFPPPQLSDQFPLPVIWLIGLPVGALAIWLLDGWVRQGEMPTASPVIALIVLLVNLLAAGATSFPGVFNTAWVLLPIAVVNAQTPAWNWMLARPAALGLVIGSLLLLVVCLRTEFSPVVASLGFQAKAAGLQAMNRHDEAQAEWLAAAEADPWSPEPWRQLAELRLRTFVASSQLEDEARFSEAMLQFRRRDPRHYSTYEQCGNWLLLASRNSTRTSHTAEAIQQQATALLSLIEYQEAVEWYPARALGHAQLAWTAHRAGSAQIAKAAAAEALRLDALNPHQEQKLKNQFVYDPQITPTGIPPYRRENAEQTMLRLRSSSGPENSP